VTVLLAIRNHGPLIRATNYWDLPPRPGEALFVSVNAGAFRVLLRPDSEVLLDSMWTAQECIVSRGPWPAAGRPDAFEVLFDDATDSPFALHLQRESFDRIPADDDAAQEWILSVWTRPRRGKPHKALERPCWYRRVPMIPYLKPRGG
jgi:hypothetical protein